MERTEMERSVNTDPGSRDLPGLVTTAWVGVAMVCANELGPQVDGKSSLGHERGPQIDGKSSLGHERGPQVDGKSSLGDQSRLALQEAREAEAD